MAKRDINGDDDKRLSDDATLDEMTEKNREAQASSDEPEKSSSKENDDAKKTDDGGGNHIRPEYDEDEFDPDRWESNSRPHGAGPIMQRGLAIFVSLVAIVLFGALFVVEFRSYTNAKKNSTIQVGVTQDDGEEKKKEESDTIMTIIESGTNYTIYLDNETGVEYVMFRVGSTISIQPLINVDGSYKQYVEPTYSQNAETTEAATKKGLFDSLKGTQKETKSEAESRSQAQTKSVETGDVTEDGSMDESGVGASSQMETVAATLSSN